MMRAHLFGSWSYNYWSDEITMTFSPTLEDPAWMYPIDVTFFNVTNNRTLSEQRIELVVLGPAYVAKTFERLNNALDSPDIAKLELTQFKISEVSPFGLIKISFSNALNEP